MYPLSHPTASLLFLMLVSLPRTAYSEIPPSLFPTGEIDDTMCNSEDLERANDSQLNVIFRELLQTSFFSHFVVDLNAKCPLSQWRSSSASHDEDEFECSGGAEELGLDEDTEPLCTVQAGEEEVGFGDGLADPFASSVLQSLSEQGFSSPEERYTYEWNQQTDFVVQGGGTPCDDDENLPDTFWMDMCSTYSLQKEQLVDLKLNPERNTGYNGTHIWKAIYEENCISTQDSCLEERVLYRLLSGLHSSTTVSIAKNYYPPSKRKNRINWESNPHFFMEKFQYHPEFIRNMHFSYVVLLRAIKKASLYLYDYDIQSRNMVEDETSKILLKRLLDTSILRSCSSVFSAFDESLMFQDQGINIQQNFKGIFHNVSSILDCVQCQQCKLHGKMAMMGYGAALKILFIPQELLQLERNDVVALINTAGRLSESLVEVREITTLYWKLEQERKSNSSTATPKVTTDETRIEGPPVASLDIVDQTVGVLAALGRDNLISLQREQELVQMALAKHPELLMLGKHYSTDPQRFLAFLETILTTGQEKVLPDAIVIGSGLAGMAAALNILDRGGTVTLVEKEHLLGGNSNKASSGINGCCPNEDKEFDNLDLFRNDTIKSAGTVADLELIDTLVNNSASAIRFLKERAHIDLSLLAQLGGHSSKRTHRPSNGMAGAEIIYHLQKELRKYEKSGKLEILVDTRVTQLLLEEDQVVGASCETSSTEKNILANNVILATGGFASDRSKGSYLEQYRPELIGFPATAGSFSTGDGVTLATNLGAATRDMDKIQIHPTGWVDPKDPDNPTKILAAELMRGVGGILINQKGKRFCNELGTRAYVTDKMLEHDPRYLSTGTWNPKSKIPEFYLILSSSAAEDGRKHVDLYTHKGLLTKVTGGLDALAKKINISKSTLVSTLRSYQKAAKDGKDDFGKTSFRGVPSTDLDADTWYVGKVTPVLHYCMGGIKIDSQGNVLREEDDKSIQGLHAAGEVTGGVHGNNRLGGNSLLECTVFGTIVGQKVPVKISVPLSSIMKEDTLSASQPQQQELAEISVDELAKHNSKDDIWLAIDGVVYDFTEFAHEHPAGFQSIFNLAGRDGSEAFAAVHNAGMLEDFEQDRKGILVV
jgi:flavocytochrome c